MKIKKVLILISLVLITGCVGYSSTGVLGTGVSIALDPRSLGTQIDDSIMQQNLRARLISADKSYIISVKTKILDGRIFLTGKVNSVEDKLKITKLAWEIKGARSVNNDLQIKEKLSFKELEESDKKKINKIIKKMSIKDIVMKVSQDGEISKKLIYNYCLEIKK